MAAVQLFSTATETAHSALSFLIPLTHTRDDHRNKAREISSAEVRMVALSELHEAICGGWDTHLPNCGLRFGVGVGLCWV